MTTYERRQSILELLRKQPGVRVTELASVLGVSAGTIRNDLNALEQEGHLSRVHGGGIINEQDTFYNNSFSMRMKENIAAKQAIAREAALNIADRDSILLDASSTAYYLARALSDRQRLRVITNGIDAARVLAQNSSHSVILIGGVFSFDSSAVTGLLSEQFLRELHIQKAFVSCSGFSLERGMTEVHLAEAQLKRIAIESSQQLIALIDSSKFGKEDLTPFARPEQITQLITDSGLAPEWLERLRRAGIHISICEKEEAAIR